jgi:aspartate aminotransferase
LIRLSERILSVQPSATLAVKARARQLRAEGRVVVDLSVGEPGGDPPQAALDAGIAAIESGRNRYEPVPGLPELRQAVAEGYQAQGLDYGPANVMVNVGAKHSLYNLAMVLFQPGDEVVLLAPSWVSYAPQLQLAGAKIVVVTTRPELGFQPDIEDVRAAITPATRGILINSPSNPCGCVIDRERLTAIDDLAREHDLVVISDEIYDRFVYDGQEHTCFATLSADAPSRTILVNGVSKSFAMTGWRVGWIVAPEEVVKACSKLQGHCTSGLSAINQLAALGALSAPPSYQADVLAGLERRRLVVTELLGPLDGVDLGPLPGGAFYVFPRVDALFGKQTPDGKILETSIDVADFLLVEGGVATVPGLAFGEPRCIRICYAVDSATLRDGLERIVGAVNRLA